MQNNTKSLQQLWGRNTQVSSSTINKEEEESLDETYNKHIMELKIDILNKKFTIEQYNDIMKVKKNEEEDKDKADEAYNPPEKPQVLYNKFNEDPDNKTISNKMNEWINNIIKYDDMYYKKYGIQKYAIRKYEYESNNHKLTISIRQLIENNNTTSKSGGKNKEPMYKEILGKRRRIYKIKGSRKEHVKYKGELIPVSDYKKLFKK